MEWIIENADTLLLIVTSTITVASLIATLTPTDKDDKIIKAVGKVINALALNVGKAKPAKPEGKEPAQ